MLSFSLLCSSRGDVRIPRSNGYMVYSAVSRWVRGSALEEVFHGTGNLRPFTLSAMTPCCGAEEMGSSTQEGNIVRKGGENLAFRAAFLNDHHAVMFADLLSEKPFRIGNGSMFRVSVLKESDGCVCRRVSASHLRNLEPVGRFELKYLSPTGFNSQGRQMPFPMPELVFGSLLRKWRAFVGPDDWPGLEDRLDGVNISRFSLRSHVVRGKNGSLRKGCMGRCGYDLSALDREDRSALNALAEFAFYAGVGYKTTQGMGQTDVVR